MTKAHGSAAIERYLYGRIVPLSELNTILPDSKTKNQRFKSKVKRPEYSLKRLRNTKSPLNAGGFFV